MKNELNGRVALVTGASRGIGRAIALALGWAGADVAVNYRRSEELSMEVCGEIEAMGRRCFPVRADVSVSDEVTDMVERVREQMGEITILVNNAGIAGVRPVEDIGESEWDEVIAVNLKSAFLVTSAVLRDMRAAAWGRIINISSVAAQIGGVVGPDYAASKAGIIGLTHFYASYLAKEGITANAIAPGPISTDMSAALPGLRPELLPVGRFGTVEEVADIALMLVRNGYITGQTINVNGGRYMS
jgi:3-oxoacyl-[acyl-carrier protein] reductase